jgi:hypothetical protein
MAADILGFPHGPRPGDTYEVNPNEGPPAPRLTPAAEALAKAASLIDGDRDKQHGDRLECCMKIAMMWNAWDAVKRVPHTPDNEFDVAVKMGLLKLVRTQMGLYNDDDMPDGLGYFGIGAEFLPALSPKQ